MKGVKWMMMKEEMKKTARTKEKTKWMTMIKKENKMIKLMGMK